jgi:hypothetical protein
MNCKYPMKSLFRSAKIVKKKKKYAHDTCVSNINENIFHGALLFLLPLCAESWHSCLFRYVTSRDQQCAVVQTQEVLNFVPSTLTKMAV